MEDKKCPDCGYFPGERTQENNWGIKVESDGCDEIGIPMTENCSKDRSGYYSYSNSWGSQMILASPYSDLQCTEDGALNCSLTDKCITAIVDRIAEKMHSETFMLKELIDSLYEEIAELQNEISTLKQGKE